AHLLSEAETFAETVSERQREKALKRWEKGTKNATAMPDDATAYRGNAEHAYKQASKHTSKQAKENTGEGVARSRFTPPSVEQVREYCTERENQVNPQQFIDHYTANGWRVGRNPMKDWRATVRTWERNNFGKGINGTSKPSRADVLNRDA